MADYNYTFLLNGKQLPATIHEHTAAERTFYDIVFEDSTLSIYKDTLYTWASDGTHGFSKADIQSIGEQILNPQL